MSSTVALNTVRSWQATSTDIFVACLDRLSDEDLSEPTGLPGWTRRHLLAHVGFNAEALCRLVRWAATGRRTPMYSSASQRAAEIERGASWPAPQLRQFVVETAQRLAADLDRLTDDQLCTEVVTAQDRTIQASEIPWLRTREVAVHAVDLGAGAGFDDLPTEFCAALVADVAQWRSARREAPAVDLVSREHRWSVDGDGDRIVVQGSPAALARWLTGRGSAELEWSGPTLPVQGRWL